MSHRVLFASFEHEDDLLAAATAVRRKGLRIVDAFTPYAVHGLDRAMGLNPSRLTWVCFVCGMTGALGMLWFEHWGRTVHCPDERLWCKLECRVSPRSGSTDMPAATRWRTASGRAARASAKIWLASSRGWRSRNVLVQATLAGTKVFGIPEIATIVGFSCLVPLLFMRSFAAANAVPRNDPWLADSLHYHA